MDLIELAALVGIIAASITILAVPEYFRRKHAEKKRSLQNLYYELRAILLDLDVRKYPHRIGSVKMIDPAGIEKTAYFMKRFLNHDFYDSLISSGTIYYLKHDQQSIQRIFRLVKTHNVYLETASRLLRQPEPVMGEIWPYVEWLEEHQPYIVASIKEVIDKLE